LAGTTRWGDQFRDLDQSVFPETLERESLRDFYDLFAAERGECRDVKEGATQEPTPPESAASVLSLWDSLRGHTTPERCADLHTARLPFPTVEHGTTL
jgi:hypothetical protein